MHTRAATSDGKNQLWQNGPEEIHSTVESVLGENGLEIDGQIDGERVHGSGLEGHADAADPDGAVLHHGIGNHGIVAGVPVPGQLGNEGEPGATEEPDDARAVPGELVAAKLEGQEQHDDGAGEDGKTGDIEDTDAVGEGMAEGAVF